MVENKLTHLEIQLLLGMLHEKLESLDERQESGHIGADNYRTEYAETNAMIDKLEATEEAMYAAGIED